MTWARSRRRWGGIRAGGVCAVVVAAAHLWAVHSSVIKVYVIEYSLLSLCLGITARYRYLIVVELIKSRKKKREKKRAKGLSQTASRAARCNIKKTPLSRRHQGVAVRRGGCWWEDGSCSL